MADAIDLTQSPIHIGRDSTFALTGFSYDGPSFEAYVDKHTSPEEPGLLMMIETSPGDWGTWERHPEGFEIVHILEGSGTFYQENEAGDVAIPFGPGSTLINPPGVWHTADVSETMKAIYITPCPGTDHKPR